MMKFIISIVAIPFLIISCSHGKTQYFPGGKNLKDPVEIIIVRNSFACGAYPVTIEFDGLDIAHLRSGEFISFFVEPGYYNITMTVAAGNTTYTANAVGVGAQAGDTDCAWMAMDHLGTKTATNTAKCW